ncbi:MAG: hypothetical protein BWY42_01421 [Candidatus Omnitrophica bacterium ADurb.Bin277]|nr:MAG: hypothetical protein BWY42_01421 [Candidatus Omnitrophica bacterium ADurb.Bin277]
MCKLNVGSPHHSDRFHNPVGILLEFLLDLGRYGQHRGNAKTVTRVNPHGIYVFDKTNRDFLIFRITHHFKLQFLPTDHRLFNEYLPRDAEGQSPQGNHPKVFDVIRDPAAGTSHRVSRTDHDRISDLLSDRLAFLNGTRGRRLRYRDPELRHGFFENLAVLPPFNRVRLDPDNLDPVFLEDAGFMKCGGKIQSRLTAEVGQQSVGPFERDDLFKTFHGQRFDISFIRHFGIRHDGRGIGIHEDDLVTFFSEGFTGLGPRIIKLAGLADNDRPRTNNQNFFNILASRHDRPLFSILNTRQSINKNVRKDNRRHGARDRSPDDTAHRLRSITG